MRYIFNILKLFLPTLVINTLKNYYKETSRFYQEIKRKIRWLFISRKIRDLFDQQEEIKVNLCSGPVKLDGYINLDLSLNSDLIIDLENNLMPFKDNSIDKLVCMSAINYFSIKRAAEIIVDVYRVLKPGGVVRFGVQDLKILAQKYLDNDTDFYFQNLEDGNPRFPGDTIADKFNYFFYYGYSGIKGKHHKYVFDYPSLEKLFKDAGFEIIKNKKYLDSDIAEVKLIDNRPEMFFYLEAYKKNNLDLLDKAKQLFTEGKKNYGWQYVVQSLELDITCRPVLDFAIEVMIQEKCYDSAILLLNDYLAKKNDKNIKILLKKIKTKKSKIEDIDISITRKDLRKIYNEAHR